MRRPVLWYAVLVAVLPVGVVLLVLRSEASAIANLRPPRDPRVDRIVAARATYQALRWREQANEPMTPTFIDLMCTWSARLAQAELATASSHDQRVAAIERHRGELARLSQKFRHVNSCSSWAPGVANPIVQYYEADARVWLKEEGD